MGLPLQAKGDHPAATLVTTTSYAQEANHPAEKATDAKIKTKSTTTSIKKTSVSTSTHQSVTKTSTNLVTSVQTQNAAPGKTLTTATTKWSKTTFVTASSGPVLIGTLSRANAKGSMALAKSTSSDSDKPTPGARLARLTAYWPSEGDYYTSHGISSTGIHLHGGHCAVDPSIIPYGSVVDIAGVGKYLAVDTGSAVISREAAKEAAKNSTERNALVIDLYFESRSDAREFTANAPKYAPISWWTPSATGDKAEEARHLFADENWNKIQSKQL